MTKKIIGFEHGVRQVHFTGTVEEFRRALWEDYVRGGDWGFLLGYRAATPEFQQLLEKAVAYGQANVPARERKAVKKATKKSPAEFRMPYGKWRDEPLSEIPLGSLHGLLQFEGMYASTRKVLEAYLDELRQDSGKAWLSFGKYDGQGLDAIPTHYLDWVLGFDYIDPLTREMVGLECSRRLDWEQLSQEPFQTRAFIPGEHVAGGHFVGHGFVRVLDATDETVYVKRGDRWFVRAMKPRLEVRRVAVSYGAGGVPLGEWVGKKPSSWYPVGGNVLEHLTDAVSARRMGDLPFGDGREKQVRRGVYFARVGDGPGVRSHLTGEDYRQMAEYAEKKGQPAHEPCEPFTVVRSGDAAREDVENWSDFLEVLELVERPEDEDNLDDLAAKARLYLRRMAGSEGERRIGEMRQMLDEAVRRGRERLQHREETAAFLGRYGERGLRKGRKRLSQASKIADARLVHWGRELRACRDEWGVESVVHKAMWVGGLEPEQYTQLFRAADTTVKALIVHVADEKAPAVK